MTILSSTPSTSDAAPARSAARGVLVMGYGPKKFVHMAKVLGRSLKLHCDHLPRAVVTDSDDPELRKLFPIQVPFRPEWGTGFMQKTFLNDYSPFEETLYIDSDCLVVRPFEQVWDMFKGSPFGVVSVPQTEGDCAFHPRVEELLRKLERPSLPIFNGGLYYFRNAPESDAIFKTAREVMRDFDNWGLKRLGTALNDEAAFAVSLAKHRVPTVPDDGSVMRYTYYFFGRMVIDTLRGKSRFLCRYLNKQVEPAIVHLLAPLCESFVYRREAVKLRAATLGVPPWLASVGVNAVMNPPYAVYAMFRRAFKRWRSGTAPIMPVPLWEVRGQLPPWQPPWQEREAEVAASRARWRWLLSRLIGWKNYQRIFQSNEPKQT